MYTRGRSVAVFNSINPSRRSSGRAYRETRVYRTAVSRMVVFVDRYEQLICNIDTNGPSRIVSIGARLKKKNIEFGFNMIYNNINNVITKNRRTTSQTAFELHFKIRVSLTPRLRRSSAVD